ncbi:hypothetical protein [Streptomyces sp. NPDC006477]|uniref:hypothetical protein n=1 Tax=Streptomyces sp. NPDC006477 TaxID=3364747 RepID=UPI0036CF394C
MSVDGPGQADLGTPDGDRFARAASTAADALTRAGIAPADVELLLVATDAFPAHHEHPSGGNVLLDGAFNASVIRAFDEGTGLTHAVPIGLTVATGAPADTPVRYAEALLAAESRRTALVVTVLGPDTPHARVVVHAPDGTGPEGTGPEGTGPEGTGPEGTAPKGSASDQE